MHFWGDIIQPIKTGIGASIPMEFLGNLKTPSLALSLLDSRFYLCIGLFPSTHLSESPTHPSFFVFILQSLQDWYAPPIPNPGSQNPGILNILCVQCVNSTQDAEKWNMCMALFVKVFVYDMAIRGTWGAYCHILCPSWRAVVCWATQNHWIFFCSTSF